MDEVDLRIIRKLVWRPDDPEDASRGILGPWDIAKELAVHGSTVKRRLEGLHRAGIVKGLRVLPHFDILGIQGCLYLFGFADATAKRRGYEWMLTQRMPRGPFFLARIDSFVGTQAMCAVTTAKGQDMEQVVALVAKEMGATSWEKLESEDWRPPARAFTALDRGILRLLHEDALRPLAEVAQILNVTPKTVRKRLHDLAKAHAFQIVPDMAPSNIRGLVPHVILIKPKAPTAAARLFNAFPDAFIRSHLSAARPYVYLGAATTQELESNLQRAAGLPDVEEARLLLCERSAPCSDGPLVPLAQYFEEATGQTVTIAPTVH
jgi:DNA-binding Lrp family transcriptional regulator